MNNSQVIDILNNLIYTAVLISLPLLATALVVGLIISVFQAATQITESTLSFLPKVGAMLIVLILISPWIIRKMNDFTINMYQKIAIIGKTKE